MTPAAARTRSPTVPRDEDQRVFLRGISWSEYEVLLAVKGDRAGVRMAYLEGDVELMTPSRSHESIKTWIARLLEAYAEERSIELNGYGSWTIKSAPKQRGVEPDECYILGVEHKEVPDLAIEVVWTHGGLHKLEIYRGLGVGEVWIWRDGAIAVYALGGAGYERVERSRLLPDLDLAFLTSFLDRDSQTQAVRAFRAALRQG